MGADYYVYLADRQIVKSFGLFGCRAETVYRGYSHAEPVEPLFKRGIVLFGKYGSGRDESNLLAVFYRLERRAHGYLGFAEAHVTAKQPVHYLVAFHILLYFFYRLQLVFGRLVFERFVELAG